MKIIDIHTHAFPDKIAPHAIATLEAEIEGVKATLDGTLFSLITSMEKAGITYSVLLNIATKPQQFDSILAWCRSIFHSAYSKRIIPFPSVHPRDPNLIPHIEQIKQEGFKGIKLHPYYQQFTIDDKDMFAVYDTVQSLDLILLMHTGFDMAFPFDRIADPSKILYVVKNFPCLKFVCSHIGAWQDWKNAEELIIGNEIYFDISYSIPMLGYENARRLLLKHPSDFVLFGSDSPWGDQAQTIRDLQTLKLPSSFMDKVFRDNSARLLGIE